MKIAIVAAGFTPAEADKLRRAMATFKRVGTIGTFQRKMIDGMLANGYEREFAERCFQQIEGFGEYGFPESHAASFALLVYASAWLKCRYPDAFAAALLNAQPMGFYAPAQIVRDAREHGVEVRPPDVNHSQWDSTLEPGPRAAERLHDLHRDMRDDVRTTHAIRLGLREIKGLREEDAQADRGTTRHCLTTPCAMSGCARGFLRACSNGWPMPMPSARSASPAARRCGRPKRSAASATATTICRCLPSPPHRARARAGRGLLIDRQAVAGPGSQHPPPQRSPRGGRHRAFANPTSSAADAAGRGSRQRLSLPAPVAARASGAIPARRSQRARHHAQRSAAQRGIRHARAHFRPGHLPAAAGLGQGRGVHDHRGRKRGRQCHRLAESVRARAPGGPGRALCGGHRPRAGRNPASSTWSPISSRISPSAGAAGRARRRHRPVRSRAATRCAARSRTSARRARSAAATAGWSR